MSIEAMKQALEALDKTYWSDGVLCSKAFNALRQAIEQAEKQEKLCKYCGGIGRVVCDGRCMPEQEPVAWVDKVWVERLDISKQLRMELLFSRCQLNNNQIPLYTAPPKREQEPFAPDWVNYRQGVIDGAAQREWVGLTDDEVDYIWGISPGDYEDKFAFPRAIEAKLKEKNT
jgi:hypothetical protein